MCRRLDCLSGESGTPFICKKMDKLPLPNEFMGSTACQLNHWTISSKWFEESGLFLMDLIG
jgi:hypothetical protein